MSGISGSAIRPSLGAGTREQYQKSSITTSVRAAEHAHFFGSHIVGAALTRTSMDHLREPGRRTRVIADDESAHVRP
jgi:hypothetical protein